MKTRYINAILWFIVFIRKPLTLWCLFSLLFFLFLRFFFDIKCIISYKIWRVVRWYLKGFFNIRTLLFCIGIVVVFFEEPSPIPLYETLGKAQQTQNKNMLLKIKSTKVSRRAKKKNKRSAIDVIVVEQRLRWHFIHKPRYETNYLYTSNQVVTQQRWLAQPWPPLTTFKKV